jgi:hypothetical protein
LGSTGLAAEAHPEATTVPSFDEVAGEGKERLARTEPAHGG